MLKMVSYSIVTYGFKTKSWGSHFTDTKHILNKKLAKLQEKKPDVRGALNVGGVQCAVKAVGGRFWVSVSPAWRKAA